MRLEGKIGIVTAAASGMGRAGALRFAREGAAVGVVDIDQAGVDAVVGEITAAGGRALASSAICAQDDFARAIVRRTANAFGGLDFVWNHVGHPGPAAIEGIDMADFDIAIGLNLRTVLVTTEAAIPEIARPRRRRPPLSPPRPRGWSARPSARSIRWPSSASSALSARWPSAWRRTRSGSTRSAPARSTRRCCASLSPAPTSSAPPGEDKEALVQAARPADPDGPHRPARGDRQRRAVPDLRRSLVRLRRRPPGRRRRHRA